MTSHTNFFQSLGWAVLNSLWQMALLWVAYQLIIIAFKTLKPSNKSWMASGLLMAGFGWFIYTFFSVFINSSTDETAVFSVLINTESSYQLNDWLQQILPVASALYLVLLIIPFFRFIRNYRYVQVIRQYGLTKINADWRIFISNVATRMGIKKTVSISISALISSPVTIGFLKPIILVPFAAINNLTPQQLEAVLLHELSHIKRYDYLVNLIINIIRTFLYFNPFVNAFVKIVEAEREKSCDEMVLQFQYNSHDYATALLMLEKTNHLHKPLIISATGNKNDLLRRVELIMNINKKPAFSFNKLAEIAAGLLCLISLNILLVLSTQKYTAYAAVSLPQLPFTSLESNDNLTKQQDAAIDEQLTEIENNVAKLQPEKIANGDVNKPDPAVMAAFANFELPAASPVLKKYQEQQVKEALEASKKVLTSQQWKEVEMNIAEVFTQKEKAELKSTYQKEINKFDWKQWEDKLRVAYDKIDWDNVNYQLSNAVNQVRMDSLQMVYNQAISKLDKVKMELAFNDMNGIPDTDVTIKEINLKRKEAQKAINNIKAIRNKKVVHL